MAYAPFGELYAQDSSTWFGNFTAQGEYYSDFAYRRYATQGRWASPDPAGLAAVNPANPQSWNRYAYVMNNPLALKDPSGLDPCAGANQTGFSNFANGTGIFDQEDCIANGGTWGDSFLGGGTSGGNGPSLQSGPPGCVYVANPDDFGWGQIVVMNCAPSGSSGGPGGGSVLKTQGQGNAPNPCPKESSSTFDYETPRRYTYGWDSPLNHITRFHIRRSPGKSRYTFQPNVTSLADQQDLVIKTNVLVFLLGTPNPQPNGNIAYTYTFPILYDPRTGAIYAGVGTDANNGNAPTNTASFVLEKNCTTPVTSFPGAPGGPAPQP
jgi:RHS repeat-associated protein